MLFAIVLALAPIDGVFMAPHYEGVRSDAQLLRMVDEIAAVGASHIVLVVQWGQQTVESDRIGPYQWGTDDDEIRRLAAGIRARKMGVVIFPILRIAELGPGRWRGALKPRDRAAWWRAYSAFVLHYARLADEVGAEAFSVGSELAKMEHERPRWLALIDATRRQFRGKLLYSANWDHFYEVSFWDALDWVGVNAYHPITRVNDASEADLRGSWIGLRQALSWWAGLVDRPLVFTEVGYPSVDGGAARPYAYESPGPVDLEEQRRAYAAFTGAWAAEPLGGAFFWLWTGEGGPQDPGYSPRDKPAEKVLEAWFARHNGTKRPSTRHGKREPERPKKGDARAPLR